MNAEEPDFSLYTAAYGALEQLWYDSSYVFLHGRYYSTPDDDESRLVDATDEIAARASKDPMPYLDPNVHIVTELAGRIYAGGGESGHGSSGWVAHFDHSMGLQWLVWNERNPIIGIELVAGGEELLCHTNNTVDPSYDYRLPAQLTLENLEKALPFYRPWP